MNPKEFRVIELGTSYNLPTYKVEDGKGLTINDPISEWICNEFETLWIFADYRGITSIRVKKELYPSKTQAMEYAQLVINNLGQNCLPLNFVRGSKLGSEEVDKKVGVLHEGVIQILITDLEYKNELVPSEEGAEILEHLRAIAKLQDLRAEKRKAANVQGTYKTIPK